MATAAGSSSGGALDWLNALGGLYVQREQIKGQRQTAVAESQAEIEIQRARQQAISYEMSQGQIIALAIAGIALVGALILLRK